MKPFSTPQSCSLAVLVLALTLGIGPATPAFAHDARLGALHIVHPAARASLPGQSSGVVYLSIENEGTTADRLLSVATPAARDAAIHTMIMDNNIMKMREIDSLALPPTTKTPLTQGSSHHLMLTGLKAPLKNGDKFPLTMTFERAGKLEVSVHVGPDRAQKAADKPAAHRH